MLTKGVAGLGTLWHARHAKDLTIHGLPACLRARYAARMPSGGAMWAESCQLGARGAGAQLLLLEGAGTHAETVTLCTWYACTVRPWAVLSLRLHEGHL